MVRQILLGSCFLIVAWFAFVNPPAWFAGSKQPGQVLAQVSPLTSPLTVTGATTDTTTTSTTTSTTTTVETPSTAAIPAATAPVNRSPISVVLVALVFLGILSVIGLILWRRR